MIHYIYHIPGVKVGCTKNLENRILEYHGRYDTSKLEILEELHDKTDKEAGDIEIQYSDGLGYRRYCHYSHSIDALSKMGKIGGRRSIENGTHNFIVSNPNNCKERVANGTHNFITNHPNNKRMKDGTHNFITDNPSNRDDNPFKTNNPSIRMVKDGTHHFQLNNPCKTKIRCQWCGTITTPSHLSRFHGPNSKEGWYCKSIAYNGTVWILYKGE